MKTDIGVLPLDIACSVSTTNTILGSLASTANNQDLATIMELISREFGFRHYALIHHDDLYQGRDDRVDLKDYPAAAIDRIMGKATWRRDPVIRACAHAENAFLWSELGAIIELNRQDRQSLELGAREGLNEGITVPYVVLGQHSGSCTFAGTRSPDQVGRYIGIAQLVGIFAFQAAKRLLAAPRLRSLAPRPRLYPRPRDCVVLAGRGHSNKEIARTLGLTPRTVDGYLTQARNLFQSRDRTELVVAALLAGEIELVELWNRQPE